MPEDFPTNGWGEWSRHVLMELKRLNEAIESMVSRTTDNEQGIAILQSKLRGKNDMCVQHQEDIKDTRKEIQKNRDMILSHRLITAAISAVTSLATAGIVAYFATKGGP